MLFGKLFRKGKLTLVLNTRTGSIQSRFQAIKKSYRIVYQIGPIFYKEMLIMFLDFLIFAFNLLALPYCPP